MSDATIAAETFDFIERISAATSVADVHELLIKELGKYGFTEFIMLDMPPPGERLEEFTIINGCTEAWFAHYTQENLHINDPIARHMRASIDPFYWDEIVIDRDDVQELRMMHDLAAFGLKQGLSIPLFGSKRDKSCIAMGGTVIDRHPRVRSALHIVSIYAHLRARRLRSLEVNTSARSNRRRFAHRKRARGLEMGRAR